jgi:hypothetical protein
VKNILSLLATSTLCFLAACSKSDTTSYPIGHVADGKLEELILVGPWHTACDTNKTEKVMLFAAAGELTTRTATFSDPACMTAVEVPAGTTDQTLTSEQYEVQGYGKKARGTLKRKMIDPKDPLKVIESDFSISIIRSQTGYELYLKPLNSTNPVETYYR